MKQLLLLFLSLSIKICFGQVFVQEINADDYNISIEPEVATVNVLGQWTLTIIPDEIIKEGTIIKVRFMKGFNDLQYQNSNARGYCFTTCSNATATIPIIKTARSLDDYHQCWDTDTHNWVVTMEVSNGDINPLDTLTINFGGGNLNNNVRAHTRIFKDEIKMIFETPNEDTIIRFVDMPTIDNQNGPAQDVRLVLNSTVNKGDTTLLRLIVLDNFGNPVEDFTGAISLNVPGDGLEIAPNLFFLPSDKGHIEVPITAIENGFHKVDGILLTNSDQYITDGSSNFIEVRDSFDNHIYWGELHNHSGISRDGVGNRTYYFAKYITGLDFFTATEHSTKVEDVYGINEEEWAQLQSEVIAFNEPDRFISFFGFETSYGAPAGHYNFIFNFADSNFNLIPNMPRQFFPSMASAWDALDTLNELIDVITIPHHTGKRFNRFLPSGNATTFGGSFHKPAYKTSIEIYSTHGLSESFDRGHNLSYSSNNPSTGEEDGPHYAQDAWAIGEKLGVIASSDNHAGFPAQNNEGVTAVYAPNLDRTPIFDAVVNRNTYGTTGERMIINFKVNEALMGDELSLNYGDKVDISYFVKGTDALHKVEVLKWDFTYGNYVSGHPKFEVIYTEDFNGTDVDFTSVSFQDSIYTDSCMYYLRVKQQGLAGGHEIWGWSSPVWVSVPDAPTPVFQDLNELLEATLMPSIGKEGNNLNLLVNIDREVLLRITIYDARGRMMYKEMLHSNVGENNNLLPTENFSSGAYYLSLFSLEENAILTIPFIIQ